MTLTQADIDAIADAVFARLQAVERRSGEMSIVDETKMMMANGIDPVAFLKSRYNPTRKKRERRAK